ncbi:hypothetical protein [Streptomyces sp. NBC_00893]|uniref:hypothetical protein n=1 Tax=Streptomyces sp. NBC_00893 TaxID=2975862 RepID=UPI002255D690|nr:hypothetical protein [Streptomyces sp. NBC_00893]MCX4851129.1 hypothetical protein [Streptomyces sp. NBC_00893]
MNSARNLLNEDRPEYERILDEALRHAHERPDLAAVGERLDAEQLRAMALNATALITATAATEYEQYVRARELRGSAHMYPSTGSVPTPAVSAVPGSGLGTTAVDHHGPATLKRRFGSAVLGAGQPCGRPVGDGVAPHRWARMSFGRRLLAALLGLRVRPEVPAAARVRTPAPARTAGRDTPNPETAWEASAPGVLVVFAVLAPLTAGSGAVLLLLVGHILKMLDPPPSFAHSMISAGWVFAAFTAVAIFFSAVGLLITALRNGSTSLMADERGEELSEDVARAREAWRHALLERGILPFLRDALADPGAAPSARTTYRPVGRIPVIGYSRPGFSSPEDGPATTSGPTFAGPDFTTQERGGPEPRPE